MKEELTSTDKTERLVKTLFIVSAVLLALLSATVMYLRDSVFVQQLLSDARAIVSLNDTSFLVKTALFYGLGSFPIPFGLYYKRWRTTALAYLIWGYGCTFMSISNAICFYRNPKLLRNLPDIGHDLLPPLHELTIPFTNRPFAEVSSYIMLFLIPISFVWLIHHRSGRHMLRRFFLIFCFLCTLRGITILITSLPDAYPPCNELTPTGDLPSGGYSWKALWKEALPSIQFKNHLFQQVTPFSMTCGDMVFSGHATFYVLVALLWHTYYKSSEQYVNWVKTTVWILTAIELVVLIGVRMHYTLDVLLGVFLAIVVWNGYHRMVIDIQLKRDRLGVWLIDSFIMYPVIHWFETHSEELEDLETERKHSLNDILASLQVQEYDTMEEKSVRGEPSSQVACGEREEEEEEEEDQDSSPRNKNRTALLQVDHFLKLSEHNENFVLCQVIEGARDDEEIILQVKRKMKGMSSHLNEMKVIN